jgi:hypothetical protein
MRAEAQQERQSERRKRSLSRLNAKGCIFSLMKDRRDRKIGNFETREALWPWPFDTRLLGGHGLKEENENHNAISIEILSSRNLEVCSGTSRARRQEIQCVK